MLTLLAMLAAGSMANADIRPLLRQQGFDGPLNGREQIDYVGHIAQGRNDYRIYRHRGVFRAAAVDHGVNRLIVMLNGSIFLGQYDIALPGACKVRAQQIVCGTTDPAFPGVITFTKRGPPREIWFDGDLLRFTFGDRVKTLPCHGHRCGDLNK
jgi:hypothetical protein